MSEQETGAEAQGTEAAKKPAKAKPEVVKVKMKDGREVDFVGKRLLNKDYVVSDSGVKAIFDFRNGETQSIFISNGDPILAKFAGHGMLQKIGDETAGVKDEDGQPDIDNMVLAVENLIGRLSGQGSVDDRWFAERAAGDGFSGASVVIKAIAEARGDAFRAKGDEAKAEAAYKDVAWVKAFLEKRLADDKAAGGSLTRQALYKSFRAAGTKTAPIIERLEKEKKAPPPALDADAELAGMVEG